MAEWLGEFEQLVMFAVLHLAPESYGKTVRQDIEHRTGRPASAGAVYTTLDRLERRGLVTSAWGEATASRGGKRKRYYTLTPAGHEASARAWDAVRTMARVAAPKLERS
jgi:PadR family transcriptional regulator, regulatory protein PadR